MASLEKLLDRIERLLDILESPDSKRTRICVSTAAMVLTLAMWGIHLKYPSLLVSLHGAAEKLVFVLVLAPPYLAIVSIGYFILPGIHKQSMKNQGPMLTCLQPDSAARRWKIAIAAGIVSIANYFLMLITSHPA